MEIQKRVQLPDGRVKTLQVPSDATEDEILGFVMSQWDAGAFDERKNGIDRNAMLASPKSGTPQGDFPLSFSNVVGAVAEPVATALSSMRGTVKAGYEGMYDMYKGDPNLGRNVQQAIQEATYEPRTSGGKVATQFLSETANKYLGPEGLDVLNLGQQIGQQEFEKGSPPALAAAWETFPTFLETVAGIKGITDAQGLISLKNTDGSPTTALQQMLAAQGLSYDALSAEVKASIPNQVARSTLSSKPSLGAKEVAARDIRAGGTQEGLARFDEAPFNPFKDVKIDPVAKQAIDLDVDEGVIQMIKQSDPSTRMQMLRVLNQHQTKVFNQGADADPYAVVGQALESRVNYLDRQADNAALKLKNIVANRFKDKAVDTSPLQSAALNGLEDLGIDFARNEYGSPVITAGRNGAAEIKLDFTNSKIAKDPASQKMVRDSLDLILNRRTPDAASLHLLKQQLDGLIDWNKADKGGVIPPSGRNFVKGLRYESNNILRGVDEEYAKVNDVLSTVLDAKGALYDSLVVSARELAKEGDFAAAGNDLRKLFTNYGKGYTQVAALKNIDDAIAKISAQPTGKEVAIAGQAGAPYVPPSNANLYNLGRVVVELDRLIKPTKAGNFQSKVAAGNEEVLRAIRDTQSRQGIIDRTLGLATKPFEKDPKIAERQRKLDTYTILQELVKARQKQ